MKLSASTAGFIKGLLIVVIMAVVSYLGDAANLNGVLAPSVAAIVASLASAIESSMKDKVGGKSALFGAVSVK